MDLEDRKKYLTCSGRNLNVEKWTWRTRENTSYVLVGIVGRNMDLEDRGEYLMCSGKNLYAEPPIAVTQKLLALFGTIGIRTARLIVVGMIKCHRDT